MGFELLIYQYLSASPALRTFIEIHTNASLKYEFTNLKALVYFLCLAHSTQIEKALILPLVARLWISKELANEGEMETELRTVINSMEIILPTSSISKNGSLGQPLKTVIQLIDSAGTAFIRA